MKILVVGTDNQFEECRQKLAGHDCTLVSSYAEAEEKSGGVEVIFDFLTSEKPETFRLYQRKTVTVFVNTWKISLRQLVNTIHGHIECTAFGFNGFPLMFNREIMEVSVLDNNDAAFLTSICEQLRLQFRLVDDRVGLVTPRVICMIINEAYFTVQEGTASRNDIDLAMKLGTNYPYGPFEWCEKIGLKYVYELLDAVYQDTRDERYKISALMKKEYLDITQR